MDDFKDRDIALRALGFTDYSEYLQSDLWAWIRSQLMKDASSSSCVICGSGTGLVWHHLVYEIPVLVGNFSSGTFSSVVRICSACHRGVHFHSGEFQSMKVAYYRFEQMKSWGKDWVNHISDLTRDNQGDTKSRFAEWSSDA